MVVLGVVVLGGIVAAGIGWLLSQVGEIVVLVLLAALLSFLLMPLVDWLQRRRIPRVFGVVISYLVMAGVLAGIALLVYPPLAQQTSQLSAQLPVVMAKFANPRAGLGALLRQIGLSAQADAISQTIVSRLQTVGAGILQGLLGAVQAAATAAVGLVLVIVLSFYLLIEGHDFQKTLEAALPADKRATLQWIEAAVVRIAGGYIRGQLLVALMVAVLGGLAAWIFGLQYPVVVAVLAGFFELIPFFGPVLSAIPAVTIALVQGPLPRVFEMIGAFIVIQQLESNVIQPRITGHAVGLHPLAVIIAVLIGIKEAGFWGAFFAVPVTGVGWAIIQELYGRGRGTGSTFTLEQEHK